MQSPEWPMKKDPNIYPKGLTAAKVRRILNYYENQTDDEAAAEIANASLVRDSAWIQVPVKLIPEIHKLIAKRRSA